MKGLILASGRGSRLGSLTEQSNKCFQQVKGKTLFEYQVQALNLLGINEIGITTGYLRENFKELPYETFYNADWIRTQMVYSLFLASDWIQQGCIVSYSDIFYFGDYLASLLTNKNPIAIAYDPNWLALWKKRSAYPLNDAETLVIDDNGYVKEIGLRPRRIEDIQGQYMGLIYFSSVGARIVRDELISLKPHKMRAYSMTQFLQSLVRKGLPLLAVPYKGIWGEVDTPSDLNLYNEAEFGSWNRPE